MLKCDDFTTGSKGFRAAAAGWFGAGADKIQEQALEEGLTTLRIGAAKLVLQGVTTITEVERIAME